MASETRIINEIKVDILSNKPIYIQIRQALERSILYGNLRPGDRIPSELELMGHFGCSRMTVNKALSQLVADGLIVRKRRSGSFVATPKSQETVLEIHDIAAEIRNSGRSYRHEILARRVRGADSRDAERLDVALGIRVLALEVLHFSAELPFVLEERLISLVTVPSAEEVNFDSCPPGTWLLQHIPWTQAEHRIRAVHADPRTAARLKIKKGSACLLVERRTWRAGQRVTFVRLTYPGERHELVAQFDPGESIGSATLEAETQRGNLR